MRWISYRSRRLMVSRRLRRGFPRCQRRLRTLHQPQQFQSQVLLQDFKGEGLQWVTLPPFSPSCASISLWGFGLAKDVGGRLVVHSSEPELEAELESVVSRHGIWGLDGMYGGREGQTLPKTWEVAKREFEITVVT